jgi:hypothetical protein
MISLMKTIHQYSIASYHALLAVLCVALAACATASGPDGTDDMPAVGTTYRMMAYGLNGAGQVDTVRTSLTRRFDTVETTVNADPLVAPNGVAFATRIIRNGSSSGSERTERYRYYTNGDIARYNPSFTMAYTRASNDTPFVSNQVSVPEHFVSYPFGSKRDYSTIRFDTTVTLPVGSGGSRTQTTRYTIADTIVFRGPVAFQGPQLISAVFPLLERPVMQALWLTMTRTMRVVSVVEQKSRTSETIVVYHYWYSPKHGFMLQEESYIQGSPEFAGTGYTALASALQ